MFLNNVFLGLVFVLSMLSMHIVHAADTGPGTTWPPANPCVYFSMSMTKQGTVKEEITPVDYCGTLPGAYLLSGSLVQYEPSLQGSKILCQWHDWPFSLVAANANSPASNLSIICKDGAQVNLSPPPTQVANPTSGDGAWCSSITVAYTPPLSGSTEVAIAPRSYTWEPVTQHWRGCHGPADDCWWSSDGTFSLSRSCNDAHNLAIGGGFII